MGVEGFGSATAILPFGGFTPVDKPARVTDDHVMTSKAALRYGIAILLAASGLYGFSLLLHPTSDAGATTGTACESVRTSIQTLLPATSTTTTTFHTGIAAWSTDPTATPEYQQRWLTGMHLVVNNPQCFAPTEVAGAQAAMEKYLGH